MELLILAVLLLVSPPLVFGNKGPLLWKEEFDGTNINTQVWKHWITGWRGGQNQFQYYHNSSRNSYVRDGVLYIKPTLTSEIFTEGFLSEGPLDLTKEGCNLDWEGGCVIKAGQDIISPVASARIVTSDSFSFTYGVVEIRAKMPKGDWLAPGIWLLPTNDTYGEWPRSGHIVLAESRGNKNFSCPDEVLSGRQQVSQVLHWGPNWDANGVDVGKTYWKKVNQTEDFSKDFHIYRLEWLLDGIRFYIDDELIGQVNPPNPGGFWELGKFEQGPNPNPWLNRTIMAPFDQKFHFALFLSVGGDFFNDKCTNSPNRKPWNVQAVNKMKLFWEAKKNWYPTWNNGKDEDHALKVDYIRLFHAKTMFKGQEYFIGDNGQVLWQIICDFADKFDIISLPLKPEECGGACLREPRCTHFSFSGGSCRLKQAPADTPRRSAEVLNGICGLLPGRHLTNSNTNNYAVNPVSIILPELLLHVIIFRFIFN